MSADQLMYLLLNERAAAAAVSAAERRSGPISACVHTQPSVHTCVLACPCERAQVTSFTH